MAARSRRAALATLLDPLQRAITCVAQTVLVRQERGVGHAATILLPGNTPVPLAGSTRWLLNVAHNYELGRGPGITWRVRTVGYSYELRTELRPLLAWHWHPLGRSPITWPHLHVHGRVGAVDLSRAHLVMGPVSLPAVLRCAIQDLGVAPRRGDWAAVLEAAASALTETAAE